MSLNLLPKAILIDAIIAIGGYGATLLNLSKFSKKEVELSVESTTLVIPETLLTSKVEIINIEPQQPSTGTPSMNISTLCQFEAAQVGERMARELAEADLKIISNNGGNNGL